MDARKVVEIENTLGKLDILIDRSGNILDHTPDKLKSNVPKSAHDRCVLNQYAGSGIMQPMQPIVSLLNLEDFSVSRETFKN